MSAQGDALGDQIKANLDAQAVINPQDRQKLMRGMGNAIYDSGGLTPVTHTHSGVAPNGPKLVQANTHETPDTDSALTALHHTLGTGANQACAGNDARLSDARTPTLHGIADATKHSSGITADRILVSDANGLPSGTIYTNANLASAVGNAHNQRLWPYYGIATTGASTASASYITVGMQNTSAPCVLTLLTSQCVAGRIYHIKDESLAASVANYIRIIGQGGELLDGQSEYRITLPGRGVWLFSNGSAWFSHAVALPAALYNALFQDGWDDLVLPATAVNPLGIVGPVVYNPTQSTLDWQDNSDCRADFSFQLPHRWHEATDTHFHLHVLHADASAGNSRWSVKWRILDRDEAQPVWTTDATISIPSPASTNHVLLPIKSFAMTGYRVSCIVQVQLTRLASTDALDTYEAAIQMMSADLHYQSDTMTGSVAEGVK